MMRDNIMKFINNNFLRACVCILWLTFIPSMWFAISTVIQSFQQQSSIQQDYPAQVSRTYADHPWWDLSVCTKRTFRVTAYYSPLEGQAYYYRPTYPAEVRLNWFGTNGASGAPVFNWMIAAPRSYAFGTQIYFPWWWVWQVEDRWQAIVQAWERQQIYDRIDIWVWRWEEWLRTALSFGVQYLEWYVCPRNHLHRHDVWFMMERFPQFDDFYERVLWIMSLEVWREDIFVYNLQRYLNKLWYFPATSITGIYGRETKAAVCRFQQKYLSLSPEYEFCGTFGPQTRAVVRNLVREKNITLTPLSNPTVRSQRAHELMQKPRLTTTHNQTVLTQSVPSIRLDDPLLLSKRQYHRDVRPQEKNIPWMHILQRFHHQLFTQWRFAWYTFERHIPFWEQSEEVMILQRKLTWLWYYTQQPPSWIFDRNTRVSLFAFQLDQWILNWTEDDGLFGLFGPATRESINTIQ